MCASPDTTTTDLLVHKNPPKRVRTPKKNSTVGLLVDHRGRERTETCVGELQADGYHETTVGLPEVPSR